MTSLIELQRSYILDLVKAVNTENGYKILLLDDITWQLVHEVLSEHELLAAVTAVEKIDQKRVSRSSIEAIYILEPVRYSVECLISDYTIVPQRYKAAHIFFLPGLTTDLSSLIKQNHGLQRSLKGMQEFYLGIHPKEAFTFTTNNRQSLQVFYNKECLSLVSKAVKSTATALVDVCVLTGEYPTIRYYNPNENDAFFNASILPKMIAAEFQDQLDDYARNHPDFPPASTRQRSVFIIGDRTLDLFAPLLHEFTYQAMAYDLKDIKDDDIYKYEAENELGEKEAKQSNLGDSDEDWVKLRHLHIVEARELITSRLEEFMSKNEKLVDRTKMKSASDILTAVARLKGFDEERRRLILHKTLIEDLLLTNGDRKLSELAELEQDLANFGVNIDGERVKDLADRLIFSLTQKEYGFEDKLRLIILYGFYRGGLIEEDYVKLFNFIGYLKINDVQSLLEYIKNFETIGYKLVKPNLKSKSVFKREFLHESISEGSYQTSRFKPSVNSIITKVITNTLEDTLFPYIKDKPIDTESEASLTPSVSLKNPRHKPTWAKQSSQFQAPRQRIFYFIAGGVSHSEIRTAYELSNKFEKDVIIGSDEILTSKKFLDEVKHLSTARESLRLYADWLDNRPTKAPKFLFENPSEKRTKPEVLPQVQQLKSTPSVSSISSSPEKEGKRSRFKRFLKK